MIWSFAIVVSLVQLCATKPPSIRWDDFVEKHGWVELPRRWEYHSPAPADYMFDLRVALKQNGIDDLITNLMETSDPTHPKYGKHLLLAEAEALVAPHQDSVLAVNSWLKHHGIPTETIIRHSGGGSWVTLRVPVAQAERMLDTKYHIYRHTETSERIVRTMSYSLPRELHPHVDLVTPTTYFGTLRSSEWVVRPASHAPADVVLPMAYFGSLRNMLSPSFLQPIVQIAEYLSFNNSAAVPGTCDSTITPDCLRTLYNTIDYVPTAANVNNLGVAGYWDLFANRADLQTFFAKFRPDALGSSYTTVEVNGGEDDQTNPGIEANLDVQYSTSMSFPTPNIYYSTNGSDPSIPDSLPNPFAVEPYLEWLRFILSQPDTIPQTITTSYGENEQTVPRDYATKVCDLFAFLGSIGTTLFFSSGDYGVGGGDCRTNDGTNRTLFQPNFPASCPFVTAVGATTNINPEVGAFLSGGGFSRYFPAPRYQEAAVSSFVKSLGTAFDGLYNTAGRGYPDLAAQAMEYQIVIHGQVRSVSGTSASSPTVAGIFTLLNDFRISNGRSSLGFINPLLYAIGNKGFNDILSGSNPGCNTTGFTATAGWDPVTGLGTPDFLKLKELV